MASYFKNFVDPIKIIFNRLDQQRNKRIIINGQDGSKVSGGKDVIPPYYCDLPEYPCTIIRGSDGKVTEIHYGKNNTIKGYIWRHILHRDASGKVDYIKQENPDGSFDITFHRNTNQKVELIDIE